MPASLLIDLDTIDLTRIVVTKEQIYQQLPHRFEFMQLDGLVYLDEKETVGVALREVRADEFWVRGHIPGRPLFPGVMMLESAAQIASFLSTPFYPGKFVAFGGLDGVKFRASVSPPARMYFIVKAVEIRSRRTICDAQGVVDGQLVFEGRITGMPM